MGFGRGAVCQACSVPVADYLFMSLSIYLKTSFIDKLLNSLKSELNEKRSFFKKMFCLKGNEKNLEYIANMKTFRKSV